MKQSLRNISCIILAFILCLLLATTAGAVSQEPGKFVDSYSEFVKQQPERYKYPTSPDDPVLAPNTRVVYINSPRSQNSVKVLYVVSEKEICTWSYDLASSSALNILRIGSAFDKNAPRCSLAVYNGDEIEDYYFWESSQGEEAFMEFLNQVTNRLRK